MLYNMNRFHVELRSSFGPIKAMTDKANAWLESLSDENIKHIVDFTVSGRGSRKATARPGFARLAAIAKILR